MLDKAVFQKINTASKYAGIYSFIVGLVTLLLIHFYYNVTQYHYDAWSYNNLSRILLFGRGGDGFSLLNFPLDIRGYVYPFLLLPGNFIDSVTEGKFNYFEAYRIYSSICYSFAFAYIIPGMFERLYKIHISFLSRLAMLITTLFFWPGLFIYPLSDLTAVIFLMLAIYLSFIILASNKLTWKTAFSSFFLGISIYAVYNIRPIYLFSLPVIILAFTINFYRMNKQLSYFLNIVCIAIGITLAAAPQIIINQNVRGMASPLVISEGHAGNKNLFLFQLKTGIVQERRETYVGDAGYSPGMVYVSKRGTALLKDAQVDWDKGMLEYVRLVISHPLDFSIIFFRHIIAGLDNRFGIIYLKDVNQASNITAAINYTMWFLGFILLKYFYTPENETTFTRQTNSFRHFMIYRGNWLLAIIVPVIAVVPGAIETRFFLPLHLLLYAQLFYLVPWKEVFLKAKPHAVRLFLSYVLFMAVMFTLSDSILANLNRY